MISTEIILGIFYGGLTSFFIAFVYIELKYGRHDCRTGLISSIKDSIKVQNIESSSGEYERLNKIISDQYEKLRKLEYQNDTDLLTVEYLMQKHPALPDWLAEDLLNYCKMNTIHHKGCYGNGKIMYPKWHHDLLKRLEKNFL